MSIPFPPSGDFDKYPLHEVLIRLITTRFSGSLVLKYEEATRSMQFGKGILSSAASDHPDEQLDACLEREKDSTLSDDNRERLKGLLESGQTYAKSLVELKLMRGTDLLNFKRNLAEDILKGALSTKPQSYTMSEGESGHTAPLSFDPIEIIRSSLLEDLDIETVEQRLGDDEAIYIESEDIPAVRYAAKKNEELKLIISHLDGKRTVKEIVSKMGLNAERTRNMLLFLKWLGCIEQMSRFVSTSEAEDPGVMLTAPGVASAYEQKEEIEDEGSAEILKLLEKEEGGGGEGGEQAAPSDESFEETLQEHFPEAESPDLPEQPARAKSDRLFGVKKLLILYVAGGAAVIFLVVSIMVFSSAITPKDDSEKELSFYPDEIDVSQLPLEDQFTSKQGEKPQSLELEVGNDGGEENPEPATSSDVVETPPDAATGDDKTEEENETIVDTTSSASDESDQPSAEGTSDESQTESVTPARAEADRPLPPLSWAEAQSRALELGLAGKWRSAAATWRRAIPAASETPITVLIASADNSAYMSNVFEKFANNALLRDQFFVISSVRGNTRRFYACWGLFASSEAALAAVNTLPERILSHNPVPRPWATLVGNQ